MTTEEALELLKQHNTLSNILPRGYKVYLGISHKQAQDIAALLEQQAKYADLRAKLEAAEEEISQYAKTTELQLKAAARATQMYNDKHGTNIGLMDFAKGEVFLMEKIDSEKEINLVLINNLKAVRAERDNFQNNGIEVAKQLMKERDEAQAQVEQQQSTYTDLEADYKGLQAQVAVMREALEESLYWLKECHPMDADEPCIVYDTWAKGNQVLSATSAEAAERVQGLVDALEWIDKLVIIPPMMSEQGRELMMICDKAKDALAKYRGELAVTYEKVEE